MTHHVLDMQHFIGNKNALGNAAVAAAAAAAAATAAGGTVSSAGGNNSNSANTTSKGRARKRAAPKAAAAAAKNKMDINDPQQVNGVPLAYHAWQQVLQHAMPRVCHVHIATRHIVDFAHVSSEFMMCIVRLLRVTLLGGYRYERHMVDFNTCLALERMFIECEQASGANLNKVLAPLREFLLKNALVVLYAVREYLVRMIELSPASDAFIRLHYGDYDMFVRYVRVCTGALRVALSHNRTLHGINEQMAKALSNKSSQKLWTSYRADNGTTFVDKACSLFEYIDQDRLCMQIMQNPYAEQYHVERLPLFLAQAVYAYVRATEPGEPFRAHWLRDLGLREYTVELMARMSAHYASLSDAQLRHYLLALPLDEYALLALFFHLLSYHAMRRLVALEPRMSAAQMLALREHYHVPCDELLPEHLMQTHCCSALACCELLTHTNSGLRTNVRSSRQLGVRQDYETHEMYCTNKRMRRDQENNTQIKHNRNTKMYERMRAAFEDMQREPTSEKFQRAYGEARNKFYSACLKNARLLIRGQHEYPCNETPAVPLPSVGALLQWCKIKATPTPMLCTTCPRCAKYGLFSVMLCDTNGYSCGVCDVQERALMREPCCLVCAETISVTREKSSARTHNKRINVLRLHAGIGYKASQRYEAAGQRQSTHGGLRYRANDDVEPRTVLLIDDVADWHIRPFMVCAGCWMHWMPRASLHYVRSEFVYAARHRLDTPEEVFARHIGDGMGPLFSSGAAHKNV
jgi:hypothetical protein